jgi:hypothetical protein
VTSSQFRLNTITANICQVIFDIFVNPVFVIRQRVFSAAGPATQINRLSGLMYPKRRLATATLKKIASLHHIILNINM